MLNAILHLQRQQGLLYITPDAFGGQKNKTSL